jgi:IS30 family transposase
MKDRKVVVELCLCDVLDDAAMKLRRKWSPGQIAGRRRRMRQATMSEESIYRCVRRERRDGG